MRRPPSADREEKVGVLFRPGVLICSFCLLFLPSGVVGQELDDAGEVARTPEDDAESLLDELVPFEVAAGVLEDMEGAGLTPHIQSLGPKSGLGASILVHRFRPLVFQTGISIEGSQFHRVGVELGGPSVGGRLFYSFRRDAEDEFWGVGTNLEAGEVRSDFLRDRHEAGVGAWYQLDPRLMVNGGVSYENNRVGLGRDDDLTNIQANFDDQDLVGLGERVELVRLSLSGTLSLITRDGFKRSGAWFQLGGSHFEGVGETDADFNRLFFQTRGYLPVGNRHTLAVRGILESNRATGGTEIPFFDLARFGGGRNGPRGFSGGRFRDRDGFSIFSEWRTEVWRDEAETQRIQAVVFFDQGGVTRDIFSLSGSEIRSSYGIGARFMAKETPELATFVYAARSSDGMEIGLKTHWPF